MAYDYHIGDSVEWDWGDGTASGEVVERFTADVSREIGGTEVKRPGVPRRTGLPDRAVRWAAGPQVRIGDHRRLR